MKPGIIICMIVFLVVTLPRVAQCVVMPDRGVLLNPLAGTVEGTGLQFMTQVGGWAELDKYWRITGDYDHNFSTRLGAAAEVFRNGNDFDFTLASDVELVATPESPIYFNPRAFFWQEVFQAAGKAGGSFLQGGYVHRCKHDVDNVQVQDSTGERRIMVPIYDSFFARWIAGPVALTSSSSVPLAVQLYCRADVFVLSADERSVTLPDRNLNNLRYGLSAGIDSTLLRSLNAEVYTRLRYSLYTFADSYNPATGDYREFSADYAIEAGVVLPGRAGGFSLFVVFEKQDLTMINPVNESRHFIQFGVRMSDTEFYY